MSNILDFLEALGRQPRGVALDVDGPEPTAGRALQGGVVDALAKLLGAHSQFACMIALPDGEEPLQDDQHDSEEEQPEVEAA